VTTAAAPGPAALPVAGAGRHVCLVKLSSLGDVIHALPVARSLRSAWPGARITWVAEAREAALLRGHPDVDEVLVADTRGWRRLARRPAGAAIALGQCRAALRRLRDSRVDVVLDLQGLLKSALFVRAARAPLRIGFAARCCREPLSALATTLRVEPPAAARHVVERYLALLGPLGVPPRAEFRLPARPEAAAAVGQLLATRGGPSAAPLVGMSPGAGRREKRWPVERFRAAAARLSQEAGARVLVLWGPGEESLARQVADGPAGPVALAPPTDLDHLVELLRRCRLVIAGDTGPLHLAAALDTPCLGLYGPTRAERNGPYGAGHRVVQSPDGRMEGITVEAVVGAARELLGP
jgi:lipopolysaccharide heptosyltransferase I